MKVYIRRIVSLIVTVALLLGVQRLVEPKYSTTLREGSFTGSYYNEAYDHQVLMIGDCELYDNFDTVTLWDRYGISSYIRGNAEQHIWQSYYMLKEALKYETPDVVVYNVLELKYDEPQKEEYNRLALDGMRWSRDKWDAIQASMTEDESMVEYLFPILRYHSRITQLTKEDVDYYWQSDTSSTISGYYVRIDESPYQMGDWGEENYMGAYSDAFLEEAVVEADDEEEWSSEADDEEEWSSEADDEEEWSSEADDEEEWSSEADDEEEWSSEADDEEEWSSEADDEEDMDGEESERYLTEPSWVVDETDVQPLGERAMMYLDMIRNLCEEHGIQLLLVKAPSVAPIWYQTWEEQVIAYADRYDLDYINYYELVDEIGIDYARDTFDGGLHLNYRGAVKCADYLGKYLTENYELEDLRDNKEISAHWYANKERQKQMIKLQQQELDQYGEVRSY